MSSQLNKDLKTSDVIWQLDHLYQGLDDPAIKKDFEFCQQAAETLASTYRHKISKLSAQELFKLVKKLEAIAVILGKLSTYSFLNFTTQVQNAEAGAFLQEVKEIASRVGKETVFFDLEWGKTPKEVAEKLLQDDSLSHYRHYLYSIRRYADHLLSSVEEQILIEKAPVGTSSWTDLFEKVFGHLTFGEQKRSEEEVLSDLYSPERKVRIQAAEDMTDGLRSQLHIITHIFNTILADKMITDRLRSYPSWESSMNLANELGDNTVGILVSSVIKRYDIVQRYYHLKKRLLDLDTLHDYDRYAPLPHLPDEKVSWPQCQDMVLHAFRQFSPKMAEIASFFFDRGWIHAPLLEGKRGGAFAHPCVPEVHPYILVNYTGNIRDVSTVAHELGHGVHQYLAAQKGYYNSDTPLVLAETASVFAELLVFHSQLDLLESPQERQAFTCQKLESIFATVFRQISMNRFEDRIHNSRRDQGELSQELVNKYWRATQEEMFGDSVSLTENYDIWWAYIPHFLHTPGYVYSYAFGELLVLALYNLYKTEGDKFVPKYEALLAAGGSLSPYELVKPFGVDLNDPLFWEGGLATIDSMLTTVE
ncbi:MAG: M3 family oligoendopeptidase [Thermodesulfobacteriota bacterium]